MSEDLFFEDAHSFQTVVCVNCGNTVHVPVYCGNRFCEICSTPRKKRLRSRLNFLIKQRPVIKGTMLKHLTLTVKNDTDLARMYKHLINSFRRMRQRKRFKQLIIGGAFVVEVTRKGDEWHAHIHAIVQSYRVEWKELHRMWQQCSKGSIGVYIKNIPPVQCVRYLSKYVTKSDLSIDYQFEASETLKHYRLFNPFGLWYAVNRQYKPEPSRCSVCKYPNSYLPFEIVYGLWYTRPGFR